MQRPQPDPQRLPPRAPSPLAPPSPRGFGGSGGALRIGESSSSQATAGTGAAKTRAAEQMAYEDACKAVNPDFSSPFASVEDAVSRLLPYHVFADYGEEDADHAHLSMTKSSAEKFSDEMEDITLNLVSEFEKQVLTFNIIARGRAYGTSRAEEQLTLERSLFHDERVNALVVQQEQQKREEEALHRQHTAFAQAQAHAQAQAQAQAQATNPWQLSREMAQSHAQAYARAEALNAAMARGERFPHLAGQIAAPGMVMSSGESFPGFARHPQHDPAAAKVWQIMMQQQQHQQHQQQQGMGVWQTPVVQPGEGTSNGHAMAPDQSVGQTMSAAAAAAANGTLTQWLPFPEQQREQ